MRRILLVDETFCLGCGDWLPAETQQALVCHMGPFCPACAQKTEDEMRAEIAGKAEVDEAGAE